MIRRLAERLPIVTTAAWVFRFLRHSAAGFSRAGSEERPLAELVRQSADGRLLEFLPAGLVDLRLEAAPVVASQKLEELVPLLEKIGSLQPRRVCEVGTAGGGTLYLLTRVSAPDAVIVSIDLSVPLHTRALRARFGKPGQRVVTIEGDSHSDKTLDVLELLLGGEKLDALLIDGDHSYRGVRSDFERYGSLVRSGGIIALHDVNEDFRTRQGVQTASISGEVPRFWRELEASHRTELLIADPQQDGYGIGIVYP